MEKKYGGTLQNWGIIDLFGGYMLVMGNIFGDTTDRWEDGKLIRTSQVVKIDYENNKLETLNSFYDLGKPKEEIV
jgi:hypothetical protein